MAKDAIVAQELADKFKTEKDSPYLRFVRGEGLDVIGAQYVPNLRTVELKPWARKGGKGVVINHEASRTSNDCYVCEIAPGKALEPQHHLFEEMILMLAGRGSTTVWNDAGERVTFEWKAGAMFAIPLNCWYRHFNGSGQEPVRYVAVTNVPSVINLYDDLEFVFDHPHDFNNRFSGEADYFSAKGEQVGFLLQTNFVAGRGQPAADRRQGARRRRRPYPLQHGARLDRQPHLAVPGRHLQEGARARAGRPRHRALGRGLFADVAGGRGAARYDWQVGTLIVPPNAWFHQHFNAGPTPARYLAFKHFVAAQCAQGCRSLDLAAAGGEPDRLRRRASRWFAACSPRRSPGTAWRRAWRRCTRRSKRTCRTRRRERAAATMAPAMAKKATRRAPPALPAARDPRPSAGSGRDRLRHRGRHAVALALVGDDAVAGRLERRRRALSAPDLHPDRALQHGANSRPRRAGGRGTRGHPGAHGPRRAGEPRRHRGGAARRRTRRERGGFELALATTNIVLSWVFIHTIFALHYAHDYYGERRQAERAEFPRRRAPDYWDFVYFSFVIGMTSQVSDVAVASGRSAAP